MFAWNKALLWTEHVCSFPPPRHIDNVKSVASARTRLWLMTQNSVLFHARPAEGLIKTLKTIVFSFFVLCDHHHSNTGPLSELERAPLLSSSAHRHEKPPLGWDLQEIGQHCAVLQIPAPLCACPCMKASLAFPCCGARCHVLFRTCRASFNSPPARRAAEFAPEFLCVTRP
jgi:hypothetical protein